MVYCISIPCQGSEGKQGPPGIKGYIGAPVSHGSCSIFNALQTFFTFSVCSAQIYIIIKQSLSV